MSEVRDTGCTFRGLSIYLENADIMQVKMFRRFSRRVAEDNYPPENLKLEESKPIAPPISLGMK